MTEYVYVVRSDWYDSYHLYGVYTTAEAATEALNKYIEERSKVLDWVKYKWLDASTVGEFFYDNISGKETQSDQYTISKVPLNQWLDGNRESK